MIDDVDIEDRIFELSEKLTMGAEIVAVVTDEYGVDRQEAWRLVVKVREERGTPRLARVDAAIERLRKLSYL